MTITYIYENNLEPHRGRVFSSNREPYTALKLKYNYSWGFALLFTIKDQ